jgi:acyl-CoA synthetase (NDP forming)
LVLENLLDLEYGGPLYAVHPKHRDVLGVPCYPDLGSLPGPVDMAAVLLGADKVLPTVQAAIDAGIPAAWVLAAGFAEAGPDGQARQDELIRLAAGRLLLCGPNCIGVANLAGNFAAYSVSLSPATRPGSVSAVLQSGAVTLGLANIARFGFRYLVSSGNEAVLDTADYIHHFVQDPHTHVIVAFLEGVRRPERFVSAAEAAAEAGKPILLLKVGRSQAARQAVQAHTGSLAGSDAVFDAVCRRLGVVRLETLDELVEAVDLFNTCPWPAGPGVGLLSLSGGQIGLVADLAEDLDLTFPPLSDRGRQQLSRILPAYSPIANPLDAWGSGDLENTYPRCVRVVAQEPDVHLLAVSRDTPPEVAQREIDQSMAVARTAVDIRRETGKPVVLFSNYAAGVQSEVAACLQNGGVPYLQGTRESLRAVQSFLWYADFRRTRDGPAGKQSPRPAGLGDPARHRQLLAERGSLTELVGRQLLAAYGIPGVREQAAATVDDAVAAAREIGYPVVLKILSSDIQHKTEIGGVRVGIENDDGLRVAYQDIMGAVRAHHRTANLAGVLVQEMVPAGSVETILGVMRDPQFGPVIVFGAGGILVELVRDSVLRLPPLDLVQAHRMIEQTKAARLLDGFRGRPPADTAALADALVRLSWLAVDLANSLISLEINPLMVLPAGQGVRAVDTLVELAPDVIV